MAFFAATSIYDGLLDEDLNKEVLGFFDQLLQLITQSEVAKTNYIVAKGILLYLNDAAKVLVQFKKYLSPVIQFITHCISNPNF